MAERPLLILPAPGEPVGRRTKGSGVPAFHGPSRERQAERLTPRFEHLQQNFEDRRTRLYAGAQGLVPEEVVVLETVGTVDGFLRGVENISGMEWMGEIEEEDIPPDDDFFALKGQEQRTDTPLKGRLFLIFTNQEALRQMLSLWKRWQSGEELPRGLRSWRQVFEQLRDVRRWGVRDRLLETGILDDWQERIEHGQEAVPCEIELWYRQTPLQRQRSRERIAALLASQGGQIVDEIVIEGIAYHALLAHLPIRAIHEMIDDAENSIELVQCEQIQFFRASGQMAVVVPEDASQQNDLPQVGPPLPTTALQGPPVVALLDGLPLQAHRRFEGRLIVDDPDGFEEDYPARTRRHGTSMASLILHGDLAASERALARPLYVRPILRPDLRDWKYQVESAPESILVLDLVHRAVRRLFEVEGDEPPAAPDVAVINLSIGIRDRPFDGSLSPMARLLDWLSWQYKVLFIVSAGNHSGPIELPRPRNTFQTLAPAELQSLILQAVAANTRHRRLLSPAEAVNVLTVGAVYDDASTGTPPPYWQPPYTERSLPSPINAQGMGYRRSIKPDLLAPGGRVVVQESFNTTPHTILNIYNQTSCPGQAVAAPGTTENDRDAVWHTRGTSNACALTSRGAALLYEMLDELRGDPGGEVIDTVPRAVWLKALLAHGANWGTAGQILEEVLQTIENRRRFKEYVTRLLGYGLIDVNRVLECTAYRATALGGGLLSVDQAHVHRFPLPPSLSGQRGSRSLTITLAWLTPVNPRHHSWRRADLWFAPPKEPLKIDRQQAQWQAALRGTLQHEILTGKKATAFVDGDNLEIQVSCRNDAGVLEDKVPYALVTTLEVAEEIGVPIYDEIRVRVQERVHVTPAG